MAEPSETQQQQPKQPEPLYVTLSADQDVTTIESLCMNCYKQGTTRLMLTRVPFFRELIVMAFECPHCGFTSNEVQSGATIQKLGVRYTLHVTTPQDLNRQVVKADSAAVHIPHLEFEIPAGTQKGCLNTIEGTLRTASSNLAMFQKERREQMSAEVADKVEAVIKELAEMADGKHLPWSFVVDDPAGNSFVENPKAPLEDPELDVAHYRRNQEQNEALALNDSEEQQQLKEDDAKEKQERADQEAQADKADESYLNLVPEHKRPEAVTRGLPQVHDRATVTQDQEVVEIDEVCPTCAGHGKLRSVITRIPHFKEVAIMAFTCDHCGYKSNEVKGTGEFVGHGTKITLRVKEPMDLTRSFLKSDTASIFFPDLDLELSAGTLGSRFTSIEGLISMVVDAMRSNPFICGDSAAQADRERIQVFMDGLEKFKDGKTPFVLIVDDPMSSSYIQNPLAPEKDPQMDIEEYPLTWKQKDELGLNDMRTVYDATTGEYLAPSIHNDSNTSSTTTTTTTTEKN